MPEPTNALTKFYNTLTKLKFRCAFKSYNTHPGNAGLLEVRGRTICENLSSTKVWQPNDACRRHRPAGLPGVEDRANQ